MSEAQNRPPRVAKEGAAEKECVETKSGPYPFSFEPTGRGKSAVADAILNRIGAPTLFLLSVQESSILEEERAVAIMVGGARYANYVRISLNPDGKTYTLEFKRINNKLSKVRTAEDYTVVENVYPNTLSSVIGYHVGLPTIFSDRLIRGAALSS